MWGRVLARTTRSGTSRTRPRCRRTTRLESRAEAVPCPGAGGTAACARAAAATVPWRATRRRSATASGCAKATGWSPVRGTSRWRWPRHRRPCRRRVRRRQPRRRRRTLNPPRPRRSAMRGRGLAPRAYACSTSTGPSRGSKARLANAPGTRRRSSTMRPTEAVRPRSLPWLGKAFRRPSAMVASSGSHLPAPGAASALLGTATSSTTS
mmetsp:Transcript_16621/g.48190  ORF Transcript_16621/g.48190 Transcript_16621/m.48190 type:complete len:209 (+) Transcript_16621:289-915(+)